METITYFLLILISLFTIIFLLCFPTSIDWVKPPVVWFKEKINQYYCSKGEHQYRIRKVFLDSVLLRVEYYGQCVCCGEGEVYYSKQIPDTHKYIHRFTDEEHTFTTVAMWEAHQDKEFVNFLRNSSTSNIIPAYCSKKIM